MPTLRQILLCPVVCMYYRPVKRILLKVTLFRVFVNFSLTVFWEIWNPGIKQKILPSVRKDKCNKIMLLHKHIFFTFYLSVLRQQMYVFKQSCCNPTANPKYVSSFVNCFCKNFLSIKLLRLRSKIMTPNVSQNSNSKKSWLNLKKN